MSLRQFSISFGLILILYFSLTILRASSAEPWNDEAWYSAPSLNLILHGDTGTPYLETTHKFWKGIDRRTYWVVPLQFFVQVPWIEIFGFSLMTMRLHATMWGLLSLICWGYSAYKLTGSKIVSLLTMGLIACDYQFDSQVSLARMDAMALGLASLGIALYLGLRTRRLFWAIALSQLAIVSCGLTHPTAGVPAAVGIAVLTVTLDWRRLRPLHLVSIAVPYLLGIVFWGWYISEAPDLFRAQFFGNVTDIDRLGGFTHPFRAIGREVARYWGMAGFAPGMNPLYRIKTGAILAYVVAVAAILLNKELRRRPGVKTLLILWASYLVTMTFYDNTKEVKYAIHIVTIYDTLLAVFVWNAWSEGSMKRWFGVGVGVLFAAVSVGGLLYTSLIKDDYHKAYLPTANFLKQHATDRKDLILAGSEFGFALGFDRNVVDDDDFTFYSHKDPKYVVISNGYRGFLQHSAVAHPEIYKYFSSKLSEHYKKVYSNREYEIFERD